MSPIFPWEWRCSCWASLNCFLKRESLTPWHFCQRWKVIRVAFKGCIKGLGSLLAIRFSVGKIYCCLTRFGDLSTSSMILTSPLQIEQDLTVRPTKFSNAPSFDSGWIGWSLMRDCSVCLWCSSSVRDIDRVRCVSNLSIHSPLRPFQMLVLGPRHLFEKPILCQGPLDERLLSLFIMMLILCQRHRLSETLVSNLSARPIAASEWLIRQTRMITVVDLIIFLQYHLVFTRFALEVVYEQNYKELQPVHRRDWLSFRRKTLSSENSSSSKSLLAINDFSSIR